MLYHAVSNLWISVVLFHPFPSCIPVLWLFGALDQGAEPEEARPAPGASIAGALAAAEARGGFFLDEGQHGLTIL